ncbi:uncharacterized protein BO80DRAFT_350508 [Aspergillus ibericus CBS 121593]|uniref:Uncharacterized protein n=1 Tax=Aspergillus ibericus CBS 121593 TaxID=1448316 RepID=A0A395H6U5_9EURO|nr:hypothetical protein BO80DRAFT_350508 [Aspergillus ibericus CBS 121593]RAL03346.1 hypothetical protein BO80DRAFT_350508 [Aspergillus ibericus CBS 121593]
MAPDQIIIRDDFFCRKGRFYTLRGQVERVDGATLRRMFLPVRNRDGMDVMRANPHFVRSQLQHYGIRFHECEFTGHGTLLLKKVLREGMCDVVPERILTLQDELHREWLNTKTPEELFSTPDWVLDKYFRRPANGQPDPARTTVVVGIPFPPCAEGQVSRMREAAGQVAGLYHASALGSKTHTVFMGWDASAVTKAAWGHAPREKSNLVEEKEMRRKGRATMHADYLKRLEQRFDPAAWTPRSPVGQYLVDCQKIEQEWSALPDDLCLDIDATDTPGIFKASFDFDVVEGIMILGADGEALEQYCSDHQGRSDEDSTDEEDVEEKPMTEWMRTMLAPKPRGRAVKPITSNLQSRTFQLKLRCRELSEPQFHPESRNGSVNFTNWNFASLVGEVDLPGVGKNVSFLARKVSDEPCMDVMEWED